MNKSAMAPHHSIEPTADEGRGARPRAGGGAGPEPKFAAIGIDLKVRFYALDGGLGTVEVTDPFDRPLADGAARFARESPQILKALQRR